MPGTTPQPLPSGRRGLDPELVAASQRERLVDALIALTSEHGIDGVKIGDLTSRARTAKRTFYAHFDSLEDCVLAAYDRVDQATFAAIAEGAAPHDAPFPRIAHALTGLLSYLATHPAEARLWVLESHKAGPRVADRRMQSTLALADLYIALHAQIDDRFGPRDPMSRVRAVSVVGAVDLPISTVLQADGVEALPGLAAELSRAVYLLVYGSEPPAEDA